MNLEGATKEIQELLLLEGKTFDRMDPVLKTRFLIAVQALLNVEQVSQLGLIGRFNLKSFNDHYQINIDPEKRLRFTVEGDTILIHFFGSTTHKGE